MTDATSIMHREIFEQPAALRRVVEENAQTVAALVADAKKRDVHYVVLAARGTSDNAAMYAKYLLQITCGLPVALAAPSVQTLWDAPVNYQNALVIGVSQSGAGEDINEVVAHAKKNGALTAAVTNTDTSPLAHIADHILPCLAGEEKAVAATKTYTTTLALFALLAAKWSQNADLLNHLQRVHEKAEQALVVEKCVRTLAQTLIHAERILTVARGLHVSTATEAALKIAETSYTTTQAFSSADLLHGPIASVATQTPCLLFTPNGKTQASMDDVAAKLAARRARVLRFSASDCSGETVPLTDPGTELLSPLVDILPAQLLAYHLTMARGFDPDNPKGLTKVTITR